MTYYPTPDHAMNHPRHSTAENTPDAEVRAWKRANGWFVCETLNCGMTEASCKRKRKDAREIKKYVYASGLPVVRDAFHEAEICLKCKEYPR